MAINTKDHVSFHQKYWLYYGYILYPTSPQKYYAISRRPQSTLGVGKSILQVPDTGTRGLDNTRPFLHSSIVGF